ncbi:hypothetical protein BDW22DRAFT_160547 [Trametopsis cervina]|nr:hypothetical protein BDW22DRAFT_160547 [Trametopsis cervina]
MAQAKQYIQQNLIDIYQPPLEITSLIETDLTEEKIATLFNSGGGAKGEAPSTAVPVPVGLAGGFTPSGLLNTLAVCVASNLYLIQFRSKTKSSEDAVVASRKLLQELILFRPGTTLYAFDLAPLALSLYCDRDLFIENGVDVQSGCTCKDPRDAVNATGFAIASTHAAKMFKDNVRAAFKSNIRDVDNPKTSRALAMRAWLASYIPTLGDMEERFREVPKINTKAMPTATLGAWPIREDGTAARREAAAANTARLLRRQRGR